MASRLREQRGSKGGEAEPGQVLPGSLEPRESKRASIAPRQLPTRGNPGKGCGCWYLRYCNPRRAQDQLCHGADVPWAGKKRKVTVLFLSKTPFLSPENEKPS